MRPLLGTTGSTACTVSELTGQIRDLLESSFPSVTIVGEISSLSRPGSGHLYFNLKDAQACIRCVIWRSTAQKLRCRLEDGQQVLGRGRVCVYAPRGDYQLVLDDVAPKGLGPQDVALRLLKEKLHKLGYFAQERKRPLPRFPARIALVTSPRGAAVRDMLEVLGRRWPIAEIIVCPVRVQGPEAPPQIAQMLRVASKLPGVDVILLARGGGSSDDLAAFNDERVADAIFNCSLPIVSAVGHEIDVTIADLVADFRALTPSEAAERVSPDRTELSKALRGTAQRLEDLLLARLRAAQQRLNDFLSRPVFRRPMERPRELGRRLDELEERMHLAWRRRLERAQHRLAALAAQLGSLSPLNVLARGYSLTRTMDGHVLRSTTQTSVGQSIEILLEHGRLIAEVRQVSGEPEIIPANGRPTA